MARVQWHGQKLQAEPVRQLSDGSWIMRSLEHGPRYSVGTEIKVAATEIIEMSAAEMPAGSTSEAAQTEMAAPAAPQEAQPMTSKFKALSDAARGVTQQIETEAERVTLRLQKAHVGAMGGIAKLDGVAAEVEKSAAEIEDFANQITNGAPPLDE